ncbi:MAG: hypothetical protein LPK09_10820 [Hymenobacteraceae bacterium]|nr:hypothetical protein [Hymenobacteraceae bacterium]
MKTKNLAAAILTSLVILSCNSQKLQEEAASVQEEASGVVEQTMAVTPVTSETSRFQRTIKLDNGFEIQVGEEEDFERFKTYSLFRLTRNGTEIYVDSSLTEYEFGDKLYPMVLPLGREKFEVLVEVNDRPSKNYLKLLRIKNNKLIDIQQLPTFISQASNLDNDAELELAGYFDYPQVWGNDNGDEVTAYNPILFYQLTKEGVKLDSTLTIDRNKVIYGAFHGFNFSEAIEVLISTSEKHNAEVRRIEAKKE